MLILGIASLEMCKPIYSKSSKIFNRVTYIFEQLTINVIMMFTRKKLSQTTRFIKCTECGAEMRSHFSQHLKRQKGACDGAEAQVYKQMPDGSTDLTTVMRRQKATEAISE